MCAHQARSYGPEVTAEDRSPSSPLTAHDPVPQYAIRVEGRLPSRWSAWFDGLVVTTEDDGTTVISGPVVDQAALHGLLQKLRDIGIPLVSLTQLTPDAPAHQTNEGN
jgi:hypothetical protein